MCVATTATVVVAAQPLPMMIAFQLVCAHTHAHNSSLGVNEAAASGPRGMVWRRERGGEGEGEHTENE